MDFESCYERIWRAGLLKKASDKGINGGMWIYIKNFLLDRQYYIKVMTTGLLPTNQLLVYHRGQ